MKNKKDYFIDKYKFMIEQIKKNPHPIYAEDRIRIAPPLCITMEELEMAIQKIKDSINQSI